MRTGRRRGSRGRRRKSGIPRISNLGEKSRREISARNLGEKSRRVSRLAAEIGRSEGRESRRPEDQREQEIGKSGPRSRPEIRNRADTSLCVCARAQDCSRTQDAGARARARARTLARTNERTHTRTCTHARTHERTHAHASLQSAISLSLSLSLSLNNTL